MDLNDRSLREVIIGLGGASQGVPRETGFDISAASEVMAMLCLARDIADLRTRIDRTLVAYTFDGKPVTAGELKATGAMLALLRDAIEPNLVRSREGTPALVHGGPFANIAHGCSSVIATRLGLHLADWVVTEAGFGFDLGAEKFFDIKCVSAELDVAAVVLVATARALKMHGGVALAELTQPNAHAVAKGLPNLEKHIDSVMAFGGKPVIALNRHTADTEEEIDVVRKRCLELGVPFALSEHYAKGGVGAVALAQAVIAHVSEPKLLEKFHPLYAWNLPVVEKIRTVAQRIYGANNVAFTAAANRDLALIEKLGYSGLPICVAKTQNSLSDDPKRLGRPHDFDITVRNIQINAGAGFLVVLTGDLVRMPGLPKKPLAETVDLIDNQIVGLK